MFFRRTPIHQPDFSERIEVLRSSGYTVEPRAGAHLVSRAGLGAMVGQDGITRLGPLVEGEPAPLTDCGFQKFFVTSAGRRLPATADKLHELQAFREELAAALDLPTLYNQGLGSTSASHHYDRVAGRA
jgi:hypothetical protein